MSNIEGPSLDSFKMSLNETSTRKQDNVSELRQILQEKPELPSEIRRMLTGPPKSGSKKSKPELSPALSSALSAPTSVAKSNPILSSSLFSTSNSPAGTASASALLKQLSVRSRQTQREKSPSLSKSQSKQQQKTEPVPRQGSPLCLDELKQSKTAKGAAESAKEIADSSKHKSAEDPKAKAMVDMICNFSKFLQNSMAKHDFSAEQMKFIMEKAMQSASKVVTEAAAAEKPNAPDNLNATAASFIENAIDDAIRSETSTESDDKSTTMPDSVLKSLVLDKTDSSYSDIQTVKEDTEKQSFISSRKRKSEDQFCRANNGTNLEENKNKKQKLDQGPEHQRLAYSQNGLDRTVTHSQDIPTAITVKKEPVEYIDNYSEYNNSLNGTDDKTQQSSQAKNSNSSLMNALRSSTMVDDRNIRQVLSENVYIKKEPEETLDSCNESEIDKSIDRSVDKANVNEMGLNKTGSVIDILKDQVSKSFKKPLGVEMKYRCQFCSSTFPNAVTLVKHIQKRHSEEKTGIEVESDDDPVKTSLEQARNTRPVLASMLSLFTCKFCGQSFENKVSLTMHERSHTNNSNKTCQCNLCGKIVSSEKYLKMHMYRHTGPNVPKGVQHKSKNKSVVPKKGKGDYVIRNDEMEMIDNKSSNDTAEEIYNIKSVKSEPVDINDEMSKDQHMYLQLISDDDKSLRQGVETETANGPVEEASKEADGSNQVIGKNNSKAHYPDLSLVKAEPTDENEIGKDITANESIKDSEEGDNAIKKLLYTNFLDEEIEKNLKESFDKDRHVKSTFDLDYTRKADSPTCHKCEICGLEFEHKGTLKVHQRGHASKTCRCQICGKTVTDKSYLKIHMRTHEPETNFGNQDRENWETVENRNKNALRCETCKLQFSSYGHFEMHQRMHNGEKAFKCDECGAGFANKNHLLSHQGVHSNLKPYKCSKCDLSFRQSSGLRLHMFVHDEEKPKKCPFCDASFSRKAHLDKHIRYHSGERPFSCEICSKSFVDKELLRQHIKKVHANGNVGKRGPYKDRQFPGRVGEQLGPNWKGFQTVYDPSDKTEIPRSSYPCGVCGEAYDEIQLLVEHLETHNKTPEEDDESDALTEEQFSQMINDDSYDNMTNDEKAGNIDDNNDMNENAGSMLTDSTIRGLLNSTSVPDSSPGMPSMSNLGFTGLNVAKQFKCPFCDESFDLPGPRIRHMHEYHPINKDKSAVLDQDDPDYFLKQHLLADRTTAEKLYEDLKSNELNSNALQKNLNESETNSNVNNLNSDLKEMKSNVKSLSKSDGNSNMNVAAVSGSKIPKTEQMDYETVAVERKNKTGMQDKETIKLPCPYCDRVYQRQSSRTRHINENHRDKKEAYKLIKEIRDRQGPFIVE